MAGSNVIRAGDKFHYLTVINEAATKQYVNKSSGKVKNLRMVLVECVCGKNKLLRWSKVASGWTKSCGCKRADLRLEKYIPPAESGNTVDGSRWVIHDDIAKLDTEKAVVVISAIDVELAQKYRWYPHVRYVSGLHPASKEKISLHRLIMGSPEDLFVDHMDGNGFDNRRENLRICTHAENIRNSKPRGGKSKYKGVIKDGNRWCARIKVDYKSIHLGSYGSQIEAAMAYDEAAIKYHGEFARTNFRS